MRNEDARELEDARKRALPAGSRVGQFASQKFAKVIFLMTPTRQCNKDTREDARELEDARKRALPAGSRVGQFASQKFAKVIFLMTPTRQCNKDTREDARELEDARKRSRFGPTDTPPHRRASQTSIHLSLDAATATWRGSVGKNECNNACYYGPDPTRACAGDRRAHVPRAHLS